MFAQSNCLSLYPLHVAVVALSSICYLYPDLGCQEVSRVVGIQTVGRPIASYTIIMTNKPLGKLRYKARQENNSSIFVILMFSSDSL